MTEMYLDNIQTMNNRQSYDFFDLMGDFGGCTEIIVLFFGAILYPVSEFSFKLKALKKLFKIK